MPNEERANLVLELVRGLTAEVHPHASRLTVTLDSPFDDLGIGSLELAELLLRIQNAFGVSLPPHVLGSAETPRDVLQAVTRSHSAEHVDAGSVLPPPVTAGGPAPAPVAASTLVDALDWHVGASPERTHIRLLDETTGPADLSYGALRRDAAAAAAGLQQRDIMPGDTVAIMLPTSREYFVTFAAVLLAGAVPVPIYPPARRSQLGDHLRRHIGILGNAAARLLVTVPEAVSLGHLLRANLESLHGIVVAESLGDASDRALPRSRATDLALVQYTSGSTGQPKGVALTHENLLANIRAMGQAADASGEDTFVSWLPLYHDMGLIGAWLSSLYYGIPLVVMAPQALLPGPSGRLSAMDANRGTISAGPNFAYELCLTKITDAELAGLDLSSWRPAPAAVVAVGASAAARGPAVTAPRWHCGGCRGVRRLRVAGIRGARAFCGRGAGAAAPDGLASSGGLRGRRASCPPHSDNGQRAWPRPPPRPGVDRCGESPELA